MTHSFPPKSKLGSMKTVICDAGTEIPTASCCQFIPGGCAWGPCFAGSGVRTRRADDVNLTGPTGITLVSYWEWAKLIATAQVISVSITGIEFVLWWSFMR